jgi:putative transposase
MPNFRRYLVPGATYFFTVVTEDRRPLFESEVNRTLLRNALKECQTRFPFEMLAIVLLPDHLHAIWTLPEGDDRYSARLGFIKKEFTKGFLGSGGTECEISTSQRLSGRRGVWQPRFWEHTIDDEDDLENHFHYIHFNPVKHGYVQRVADWSHSSFHRYVRQGWYPVDWACSPKLLRTFEGIATRSGE